MPEGTITVLKDNRIGIITAEGGADWFFSPSALVDVQFEDLQEGQRVSFDNNPVCKVPTAGNVKLI